MTTPTPPAAILLYQTEDGQTRLDVALRGETVWLSLNQLAELFQRDKSVISRHIKNVFEEGELSPEATVADFATVQSEGDRRVERQVEHFNLDVIISVGYRVKSQRRSDVTVAKNYLAAAELDVPNRIVTVCLEFAELHALNQLSGVGLTGGNGLGMDDLAASRLGDLSHKLGTDSAHGLSFG